MLENTLALKKNVLSAGKKSNNIDIKSFIKLLEKCLSDLERYSFSNGNNIEQLNIHAVLLSVFFELNDYSLQNWKAYFNHFNQISKILGLKEKKRLPEGRILELLVLHTINNVFSFNKAGLKIKAYISNNDSNPTYLTDDTFKTDVISEKDNERLINNLTVKMKVRGEPAKEVWGDNDVIVCVEHEGQIQQFCIISCKVSLRERVYQSLFWSLHSRLEGTGKHTFVTIDKGDRNKKSEIGSRLPEKNDARKTRNVLESAMDRVYVFRGQEEVSRSQIIKDFDFLEWDLDNWSKDFTGTTKS